MATRPSSPTSSVTSSARSSAFGENEEVDSMKTSEYVQYVGRLWRGLRELTSTVSRMLASGKSGDVVRFPISPEHGLGDVASVGLVELTAMAGMVSDAHAKIAKKAKDEFNRRSKLTPEKIETIYRALERRSGIAIQQTFGNTAYANTAYQAYAALLTKNRGKLTKRQISARRLDFLVDQFVEFAGQIEAGDLGMIGGPGVSFSSIVRPLLVDTRIGSSALLMSVMSYYSKRNNLNRPENRILLNAPFRKLFGERDTRIVYQGRDISSAMLALAASGTLSTEEQTKIQSRVATSSQTILQIFQGRTVTRQAKGRQRVDSLVYDQTDNTISSTMFMRSNPYWLIPVSYLTAAFPDQADNFRSLVEPNVNLDETSSSYGVIGNTNVARATAIMLVTQALRDQFDQSIKNEQKMTAGGLRSPPRSPRATSARR